MEIEILRKDVLLATQYWIPCTLNNIRINLLEMDFFFQTLAHPVFKMWVIQKPNKVALWNKRHFEEKKMEIIEHV